MGFIESPAEFREAQNEGWIDRDGNWTEAGAARGRFEDAVAREHPDVDPRTVGRGDR